MTLIQVRKIMSQPPIFVDASSPIDLVAVFMRRHAIGFVPVLEGERLVGSITDRDLVVRVLTQDKSGEGLSAADVMKAPVLTCFADQPLTEAAYIMGDYQVRRLAVLDRDGSLVGVLSVGDIAEHASEILAGETLGEIVEDR